MNTPTPRTDEWVVDLQECISLEYPGHAARRKSYAQKYVPASFARQLETELAAAQERIKALEGDAGRWHDKWEHGCDALCCGLTLWVKRCPHCGRPAPDASIDAKEADRG